MAAPDSTSSSPQEFERTSRFGKYEIPADPATGRRRVLGQGGMGVTYKAREPRLDRIVVLKVISSGLLQGDAAAQARARDRFQREARALAHLHHPAIPTLFDFGEESGEDYYAMEFVAGEDLDRRIKRSGALPLAEALAVGEQAARALGAAHRAGIIHRDVKPSNLMVVDEDGHETLKLIDFGLAKGSEGGLDLGWSSAGDIRFTPLFASPEQCQQRPAIPQSDLYSLGVTLWFLLTGHPTFRGTSLYEVQAKHITALPPLDQLPPSLPPALRELLARLLAKDPSDRPESALHVAAELGGIARQLAARPTGAAQDSLAAAATIRPAHPAPTARESTEAATLAITPTIHPMAVPPAPTPTRGSDIAPSAPATPAPVSYFPNPSAPAFPPAPKPWIEAAPAPAAEAVESGLIAGVSLRIWIFAGVGALAVGMTLAALSARSGGTRPAKPAAVAAPGRPTSAPAAPSSPRETPGAAAVADNPAPADPVESEAGLAAKRNLLARLRQYASQQGDSMPQLQRVLQTARGMGAILKIPFQADARTLSAPEAKVLVQAATDQRVTNLTGDPNMAIICLGYASDALESEMNQRNSRQRSQNVAAILREQAGITNTVFSLGLGDAPPLGDGSLKNGVEVWAIFP